MGVRPPSNDIDDEPDTIEFGIAALDAHVEERTIPFPISKTDLTATHGDIRLAVDAAGKTVTLAEALAECDQESFESKQDLLNALHPVFEKKRAKSGVIDQIRSLLPF